VPTTRYVAYDEVVLARQHSVDNTQETTDEYPKLEPSSPLATNVNAFAASRMRLVERGLH
jgi:hypothetical protein